MFILQGVLDKLFLFLPRARVHNGLMKITFLGSGAWASALAYNLCRREDREVTLYGRMKEEVDDININHRNSRYFADVLLPNAIHATLDPKEALEDAEVVVLAVPSSQITNVIPLIEQYAQAKPMLVNVIKGFDPATGEGISQLIQKSLGGAKERIRGVVSLVGPSFAYDVIHNDLTAVCAVSEKKEDARFIQELFSTSAFRVYVQSDVVGAEVGTGMKNIIAIASGMMEGLGYKDNTRAALITRGLAEITRYGVIKGANPQTFLGLTGVGDLTLTCSSHRSRNYTLGYEIGLEDKAEDVLARNQKTVEGVIACKTIHLEAKRAGISVPITDAIYEILYEGKQPSLAVFELMSRSLKEE